MEMSLGGFGDRRLEKGGPICWRGWFRTGREGSGCVVWAGIGQERSVSPGFVVGEPYVFLWTSVLN